MTKSAAPRRLARSVWTLYTKAQRDAVLKALAVETDPGKRRILRDQADRYERLLKPEDDRSIA